ncbi:hypothetical protein ACJX0J_014621, partial [Zea mays]
PKHNFPNSVAMTTPAHEIVLERPRIDIPSAEEDCNTGALYTKGMPKLPTIDDCPELVYRNHHFTCSGIRRKQPSRLHFSLSLFSAYDRYFAGFQEETAQHILMACLWGMAGAKDIRYLWP